MLAQPFSADRPLPEGVRDLLFADAAAIRGMASALRGVWRAWGYHEIILPTFEYASTLATDVGSQIDAGTDTVPVRVALPSGSGLAPGAFLDVRIVVETRRDCLAVPEDAVVAYPGGGSAIAVVHADTAVLTPVKAGVRDKGLVEVEAEGITEGTQIVVEGAYGLPKETKIKVMGR